MWCIPPQQSAEFVYHLEDVLDLYQQPPDPQRPVVCVDETFQQLIGEVRDPLPIQPGQVERYDSIYMRNGVASIFIAFEPLAGWRHVAVTDSRRRGDWAHFVAGLLEGPYRDAPTLVLVMDQLNTHSPASLYEAFAPAEAMDPAVPEPDPAVGMATLPGVPPLPATALPITALPPAVTTGVLVVPAAVLAATCISFA